MATTWRVARSILHLFEQLQEAAPAAAPRPAGQVAASEWGTIGDPAHDPSSDHSPKNFLGWGAQIVTAGDIPNRPGLGLDAHAVFDAIRRSRDPRVKYMISNDQICSSYATSSRPAWTWGPYNPNDPNRDRHMTHGHLSVVGDARSDGTQDWQISGTAADTTEDDDMGATIIDGTIGDTGDGPDNINTGRVKAGADPRPAWLSICNDLAGAEHYALRLMWTKGDNAYAPLELHGSGVTNHGDAGSVIPKGIKAWCELPQECVSISVYRQAISADGDPVDPHTAPAGSTQPYAGPLGYSIERGAVVK